MKPYLPNITRVVHGAIVDGLLESIIVSSLLLLFSLNSDTNASEMCHLCSWILLQTKSSEISVKQAIMQGDPHGSEKDVLTSIADTSTFPGRHCPELLLDLLVALVLLRAIF